MRRTLFWLALLLGAIPPVRGGQIIETDPGAGVAIEFIQHFDTSPPTGWIPAAVRIANGSATERSWQLAIESESGVERALLGEWTFRVPGGETREFNVFIPQPWFLTDGFYARTRGVLDGPGVRDGNVELDRSYYGSHQTRFTGMSLVLAAENWSRLEAELSPPTPPPGPSGPTNNLELSGVRLDPARLPADWRTWSGFATVWLHRDDWMGLSGAQRVALLRWVAQGGELYLAGAGSLPEDVFRAEFTRIPGTNVSRATYGFGVLGRASLEGQSGGAGPRLAIDDVARVVRGTWTSPSLAHLTDDFTSTGAEREIGEIRPGGLVLGLVIAAIAILLGPVNMFLLAPARRRARLFVTVPVISLGGAVALVMLILLQDGTGGHGQRGVLIALLPDRPEALVLQEQTAMTGLLMNRAFPLADDATLIDYTTNDETYNYRPTTARSQRAGLNRAAGEAHGAWFTSRSVVSHHVRMFAPTRAALTMQRADAGGVTVISTCPGILRDVIVLDREGRKWWAAEIAPGTSVTLAPAGPLISDRWEEQLTHFGASLEAVASRPAAPLTFHATAVSWDESIPVPTLSSIKWRNDLVLVTGPVKEAKP